ncbi:hypothetical protein ACH5RR_018350 [Cinchona calisaya]|uniref:Uncharacterized protein n=1 Tax=Cinchona calisaya TaxID=153742 RepID=A0ABD2ZLB3_9GENT
MKNSIDPASLLEIGAHENDSLDDAGWSSQQIDLMDEKDDITVADLAAPCWERQAGPTWWCHFAAGHPCVNAWFNSAQCPSGCILQFQLH